MASTRGLLGVLVAGAALLAGCALTPPIATPGAPLPEPPPVSVTTTPATTASASAVPPSTVPAPPTPTATRTPTASGPTSTRPARPTHPATTAPVETGACTIPTGLLGRDLTTMPGSGKVIALTFDAGGDDTGTAAILFVLADKDAPATFFLTGRYARSFPASARAIARDHPIGNHTSTHPDLTTLDDAAVRAELAAGAAAIKDTTGQDPHPYFRFPFGAVDAHRIAVVNGACYVPFRWTTDTLGWKGTSGGQSVTTVTDRVLGGATPGGIVLMHVGANPNDGSTLDADALPGVIDGLRGRGYTLVTLERALPATP